MFGFSESPWLPNYSTVFNCLTTMQARSQPVSLMLFPDGGEHESGDGGLSII